MSRTTSATNDGGIAAELWNWARGCHSTEAAVEFRRGLRIVVSSDQEVAIGLVPSAAACWNRQRSGDAIAVSTLRR